MDISQHRLQSDRYTYVEPSSDNVFLVRDIVKQRSYAVKIIPIHEETGLSGLKEIDILRRFRHPSLLHARDILRSGQIIPRNCIGLVLPLGKWTLDNAIEKQLLTPSQCVDIMWKLSCGLAFLHQHNVLHLNLGPNHIILRGDQDKLLPLIADFSCVRYGQTLKTDQLYTSFNYRPPELFAVEATTKSFIYSRKTDVWSLGVIFLEMLTFRRQENLSTHFDLFRLPEQRLSFLRKHIPFYYYDAVDLLFRMLDPDPETRLDSQDLLTSSFFTARINYPVLHGEVKPSPMEIPSYQSFDGNFLNEVASLLAIRFKDFSKAAWQGALNIYSRIGVNDLSLFWVALFIGYKLYDDPKNPCLEFFVRYSKLSHKEFLEFEREIIFSLGGSLSSDVDEFIPLSQL